ncbi:hypothetical protein BYT27DRAFT_7224951 [Phlegmacium glaucopus]|nr:hypothetical protein BYT27DRAFT_7224951 [Phlegmacium glaucopus]
MLPFTNEHLYNLSFIDRVFTRLCQAYIFKDLHLGYNLGTESRISKKLQTVRKIDLERVSIIRQPSTHGYDHHLTQTKWLAFHCFSTILPSSGIVHLSCSFIFEDPIIVVGRLIQSFFSETLTVLHLTECRNVPSTLFLICLRLREIFMDHVEVTKENYDTYPNEQRSDRELPCPHEKKEIACLQPLLHAARNTLEEFYLTRVARGRNITMPTSNKVTNLLFDFTIAGEHPFDGCFKEDYGLNAFLQPLELNLETSVQDKLYERITEKIASLSNYANIDIHLAGMNLLTTQRRYEVPQEW